LSRSDVNNTGSRLNRLPIIIDYNLFVLKVQKATV
jgi:hypothetical protein